MGVFAKSRPRGALERHFPGCSVYARRIGEFFSTRKKAPRRRTRDRHDYATRLYFIFFFHVFSVFSTGSMYLARSHSHATLFPIGELGLRGDPRTARLYSNSRRDLYGYCICIYAMHCSMRYDMREAAN